jgi:UPF0271 protein
MLVMPAIDLNCDVGESFGAYQLGADADVLRYVTSANIACGFHAGDPGTMRRTVSAALKHGVALGAHPGFPDLAGFGRRNMELSVDEVHDLVVYQVGALSAFAVAQGARLAHVKPHGALYNMAAARRELADAIARAVRAVDAQLVLFGLAGSQLVAAGRDAGLRVAEEVFADRRYDATGALAPRGDADAVVSDSTLVVRQALRLARDGRVTARNGEDIAVRADTICIHGDTPGAAELARQVRVALERDGVTVAAPARVGAP